MALAAKMQGKYWEFHRAMLESQGQANEASALRVAEKVGLDMAKLKKDMASAEVEKEIDDTRALAAKLGIQGTPHFMVADRIIPGAPENLLEQMTSWSPRCARKAARSAERRGRQLRADRTTPLDSPAKPADPALSRQTKGVTWRRPRKLRSRHSHASCRFHQQFRRRPCPSRFSC